MKFIPLIHDQICYGMILFVFSLFTFGIDGMSISFHSCQMVNFFMKLMESAIPHHYIPNIYNLVAALIIHY